MRRDERIHVTQSAVLSDEWNRLEKVSFDYTRSDGTTQSLTREVYHVDDGATALLYDETRRTIVLVRQFRLPAYLRGGSGYLLEAPAGLLGGELADERIKQEIEEEAGYRVRSVTRVFEAVMMPGSAGHCVHCFVAPYSESDKVSGGGGLRHEGEDIEVVEMSIDEALGMMVRGEIVDAKTMLLLLYAQANLLPAK